MLYLTVVLLGSIVALAQAVVAAVPVASFIDTLTVWIQSHLISSLASIGLVVEILVRYIPSDKPKSILLVISAVVHSLAKMLDAVSQVLDGLLQNVDKPKAP